MATAEVTPTVADAAGDALPDECTNCGRRSIVDTVVPPRHDDSQPVPGPDGNPVKDGAHVLICALCGAVNKVFAARKPKAKSKAKPGARTGKRKRPAGSTSAARKTRRKSSRRKAATQRKPSPTVATSPAVTAAPVTTTTTGR